MSELSIENFLKNIKIVPKKLDYYIEALTHRSYSNESGSNLSYERLEFFGDSILNKIVSEYLFKQNLSEGEMSSKRIQMVQSKSLVAIAKIIKLDKAILLGKGLKENFSNNIIEDCFEALIAAIFLDHGEHKVKQFLNNFYFKNLDKNILVETVDYKTLLQEALQHHGSRLIKYKQDKIVKKDDQKFFCVSVWCDGICYGKGEGVKLKEAEKFAAKNAYSKISK